MKDLTFKASATYNTTNTRRDIFYGEDSSQAYRSGGVYGSTQMQKDLRWQSSNTLTYRKKINKKNTFDVMLGHEFAFRSSELLYGQAKDFPFANLGNDNLGIGATLVVYLLPEVTRNCYPTLQEVITISITVTCSLLPFVLTALRYSLQKTNGDISRHSLLHGVYRKKNS